MPLTEINLGNQDTLFSLVSKLHCNGTTAYCIGPLSMMIQCRVYTLTHTISGVVKNLAYLMERFKVWAVPDEFLSYAICIVSNTWF